MVAGQPTMLAFLLSRCGYFVAGVAVGIVVRGILDRWFGRPRAAELPPQLDPAHRSRANTDFYRRSIHGDAGRRDAGDYPEAVR